MRNFLFFIIVVCLLSSCIGDNECQEISGYVFEIPATLSPANRVFKVGDTITVNSHFSDMVYDRSTDREHLLEDFLFHPIAGFGRLDTMGIDSIELISTKHIELIIDPQSDLESFNGSADGLVLFGQYEFKDSMYSLEYKFVCKHPGLYYTQFNSLLSLRGDNQDFPGKCPLDQFKVPRTILNNGAQNNADLLLEAVDPGWHLLYQNRLERDFLELGGYCFRVEE